MLGRISAAVLERWLREMARRDDSLRKTSFSNGLRESSLDMTFFSELKSCTILSLPSFRKEMQKVSKSDDLFESRSIIYHFAMTISVSHLTFFGYFFLTNHAVTNITLSQKSHLCAG